MVTEISIDEDIPIEIKSKVKSSYSIIQKETIERAVNRECMKVIL